MKLLVTAAVGVLTLAAYAQKEVAPSYTTEPVTYQAAHCPDGYQLQRWEDHDLATATFAVAIYRPSGYYPVWNSFPAVAIHPDKCVKVEPSPAYGPVSISGPVTTLTGNLTTTGPAILDSNSLSVRTKGELVIHQGKLATHIPTDENTTIEFIPNK